VPGPSTGPELPPAPTECSRPRPPTTRPATHHGQHRLAGHHGQHPLAQYDSRCRLAAHEGWVMGQNQGPGTRCGGPEQVLSCLRPRQAVHATDHRPVPIAGAQYRVPNAECRCPVSGRVVSCPRSGCATPAADRCPTLGAQHRVLMRCARCQGGYPIPGAGCEVPNAGCRRRVPNSGRQVPGQCQMSGARRLGGEADVRVRGGFSARVRAARAPLVGYPLEWSVLPRCS
jgi:hypothetical protein